MDIHLPSHVSFGFHGERAIALDLSADRYFLLGPAEAAALAAFGRVGASEPGGSVAEALVQRGLLAPGAGAVIEPVAVEIPQESAIETGTTDGHVRLLEAARFRASAGVHLRFFGLKTTLDRWRQLRGRYGPDYRARPEDGGAARIARGYARARTYLPAKQLCIPDSLALARSLWRRGLAADIYFGVRLLPFMAHAWVQHGDILLSDKLGTVNEYTPVFRL